MVRRELSDPADGRYYHVVQNESIIRNWDGHTVDPGRKGVVFVDFNRNYPCNWRADPGHWSGIYPLCFRETRAMADFVTSHPNLCLVLDIHNGSGAIMYPPAFRDESEYPAADMALMRRLFAQGERLTGLPAMCSLDYGFSKERTRDRGCYCDWLYESAGLVNAIVECGNIFMSNLGLTAAEWWERAGGKPPDEDDTILLEKNKSYKFEPDSVYTVSFSGSDPGSGRRRHPHVPPVEAIRTPADRRD